jgi:hypothetical protein
VSSSLCPRTSSTIGAIPRFFGLEVVHDLLELTVAALMATESPLEKLAIGHGFGDGYTWYTRM